MVDRAPILIVTIPINLGSLSSSGTLHMIFSGPPGVVTVNDTRAIVVGATAIWNTIGLTADQMAILTIRWTENGGGVATVILNIK